MARLLGLDEVDTVRIALRHMLSVLSLQGADERITTLHQSFPDYMLDESRSVDFYCDTKRHNAMLAQQCFDLMKVPDPPFNICDLDSSYVLDKDVKNLGEKINAAISNELFYGCHYWAAHLLLTEGDKHLVDELHSWVSVRLLLWLEVMNLKRCLSAGTGMLSRVDTWLKHISLAMDTTMLIRDAYAFSIAFMSSPMPKSTPHIYVSALSLWPDKSPVSQVYSKWIRGLIKITGGNPMKPKSTALVTCRPEVEITCMTMHPSGTMIISGCNDGVIYIWDIHTGKKIGKPLIGPGNSVESVACSPDGGRIVSGSWDRTIRIWDAHTGLMIGNPLKGHYRSVDSVAYSPDGARIVSESRDNTIRIWDVQTQQIIGEPIRNHADNVNSVVYSPGGARIASGSSDNTIRIWDSQTKSMIVKPLNGHTDSVNSLAYSPDGARLVSGSSDWTICIWDANTGQRIGKHLRGHTDSVNSVAYAPNGKHFISSSDDNTIRIWDACTGQTTALNGHTLRVFSVAYALGGTRIVSGSSDRTIRIWDAHADPVDFIPSLLTGTVGFYALQGVKLFRKLAQQSHTRKINCVAYSPDGLYIASGGEDGIIHIWDVGTGEMAGKPLQGHATNVTSIAYSPNGSRIISGLQDKTICIWDLQARKMIGKPLAGHLGCVFSVAYSPNGARIASGAEDNTILIWDVVSGQVISRPLRGHTGIVNSVAYAPNSQHIVSGSGDHTIRIWDVHTRQAIGKPLIGHTSPVRSVSYSPDGMYIASGSSGGSIRVWSTHSGQLVGEPLGHSDSVGSVAWSHDGARIACGFGDGSISIWDLRTQQRIGRLEQRIITFPFRVNSIAFSPRGTTIVSCCSSIIRIWDLSRTQLIGRLPDGDQAYGARAGQYMTRSSCQNHSNDTLTDHAPDRWALDQDDWAVIDISSQFERHSLDSWVLDQDGWAIINGSDRLFWVPPDIQGALQPSHMITVIPQGTFAKFDFNNSLVGDEWKLCYQPTQPSP